MDHAIDAAKGNDFSRFGHPRRGVVPVAHAAHFNRDVNHCRFQIRSNPACELITVPVRLKQLEGRSLNRIDFSGGNAFAKRAACQIIGNLVLNRRPHRAEGDVLCRNRLRNIAVPASKGIAFPRRIRRRSQHSAICTGDLYNRLVLLAFLFRLPDAALAAESNRIGIGFPYCGNGHILSRHGGRNILIPTHKGIACLLGILRLSHFRAVVLRDLIEHRVVRLIIRRTVIIDERDGVFQNLPLCIQCKVALRRSILIRISGTLAVRLRIPAGKLMAFTRKGIRIELLVCAADGLLRHGTRTAVGVKGNHLIQHTRFHPDIDVGRRSAVRNAVFFLCACFARDSKDIAGLRPVDLAAAHAHGNRAACCIQNVLRIVCCSIGEGDVSFGAHAVSERRIASLSGNLRIRNGNAVRRSNAIADDASLAAGSGHLAVCNRQLAIGADAEALRICLAAGGVDLAGADAYTFCGRRKAIAVRAGLAAPGSHDAVRDAQSAIRADAIAGIVSLLTINIRRAADAGDRAVLDRDIAVACADAGGYAGAFAGISLNLAALNTDIAAFGIDRAGHIRRTGAFVLAVVVDISADLCISNSNIALSENGTAVDNAVRVFRLGIDGHAINGQSTGTAVWNSTHQMDGIAAFLRRILGHRYIRNCLYIERTAACDIQVRRGNIDCPALIFLSKLCLNGICTVYNEIQRLAVSVITDARAMMGISILVDLALDVSAAERQRVAGRIIAPAAAAEVLVGDLFAADVEGIRLDPLGVYRSVTGNTRQRCLKIPFRARLRVPGGVPSAELVTIPAWNIGA